MLTKVLIATFLIAGSQFAHAKTVIQQTLYYTVENQEGQVAADANKIIENLNKGLSENEQIPLVPDTITFDGKLSFDFWALNSSLYNIYEKYNISIDVELTDPDNTGTCYYGNGKDVADLISGMSDGPYSDQLSISATKYKTTSDGEVWDKDAGAIWNSWDTTSENVLILFSTSDSGEEQNIADIAPCQ